MASKEAIAKLNVLSSYDTTAEKREEYKQCINDILKDLKVLDILQNRIIFKLMYFEDTDKYFLQLKQEVDDVEEFIIIKLNKEEGQAIKEYLKTSYIGGKK